SFRSLLPSSPRLTPFPYTTLFRSNRRNPRIERRRDILRDVHIRTIDDRFGVEDQRDAVAVDHLLQRCAVLGRDLFHDVNPRTLRSEEHTSELQSRENLVCRLLLET